MTAAVELAAPPAQAQREQAVAEQPALLAPARREQAVAE
jgi:hypothetical protein